MRIGVVSDTHNHLPNVHRIVELFNEAGVDRVIHTGDITRPRTLEAFAPLRAPLVGVFGNNDLPEQPQLSATAQALHFEFQHPPLELHWHRRRIIVVHDPLEFDGHLNDQDLALHGHTHRQLLETRNQVLHFNPGECAGHLAGRNAVGIVNLNSLEASVLYF